MLRDAGRIAAKDLRIERRSRVLTTQVLPFALIVIVLFAFALDASTDALRRFTPGLFWVTVLFAAVLSVQRIFAVEVEDGALDALRLSGVDPASIFLGKAAAIATQLVVVEVLLGLSVVVFYDAEPDDVVLAAVAGVVAAGGVAAAGSLYGALVVNLRVRDTLLPVLLLPVLAPVLIAATRAYGDAFGTSAVDGWAWLGVLGLFGVIYLLLGILTYGVLLEES
ncbi:MAG: heme exporter protein CcmB [Acidimicrobiia bacterium]|nr:heme exporter protein CcmB [Acidimicrobiia bacterium]MDH5238103.1 heme exporter protein CcmB [Acidimicrobiia bacterium]